MSPRHGAIARRLDAMARPHRRLGPELAGGLSLEGADGVAERHGRLDEVGLDNSSRNERNPHDPPQRVRAGDRASDEMAHLWLQVLPQRSEDRALLQEATMRARLRKYPGDFVALANLGSVLESAGKIDEAIATLRAAVAARPDHAQARNMLGTALQSRGQLDEAMAAFVLAAKLQPGYLDPEYNLGNVLLAKGRPVQAVPRFERVLQASPDDAAALSDLGSAYAMLGRFDRATQCLERS